MDHHSNPPDEESRIRDGRVRNDSLIEFVDFPSSTLSLSEPSRLSNGPYTFGKETKHFLS
jgi:hypothetical protein